MNKYQEALDYFAVSLQVFDETVDDKPYRDELDSKRETAREVSPRYCSICGQRLDWSEE